jgi:hypothetical protein
MNSSAIAAKLAIHTIAGLTKSAGIPAPAIIRRGLERLARNRRVPKFVSGSATGVKKHLVPINSANVSDTATDLAIGAGMAVASDRVAKHVIDKLDDNKKKKSQQT